MGCCGSKPSNEEELPPPPPPPPPSALKKLAVVVEEPPVSEEPVEEKPPTPPPPEEEPPPPPPPEEEETPPPPPPPEEIPPPPDEPEPEPEPKPELERKQSKKTKQKKLPSWHYKKRPPKNATIFPDGATCDRPGVWPLDEKGEKGYVACISVAENATTRNILATWNGWKPQDWDEAQWADNLQEKYPLTATETHHHMYKTHVPRPNNPLLKKCARACGVLINISDIQETGKYADHRFLTFQGATRAQVERACYLIMDSTNRGSNIYTSTGGNMRGQLYDPHVYDAVDASNMTYQTYINSLNAVVLNHSRNIVQRKTVYYDQHKSIKDEVYALSGDSR